MQPSLQMRARGLPPAYNRNPGDSARTACGECGNSRGLVGGECGNSARLFTTRGDREYLFPFVFCWRKILLIGEERVIARLRFPCQLVALVRNVRAAFFCSRCYMLLDDGVLEGDRLVIIGNCKPSAIAVGLILDLTGGRCISILFCKER
jgi:hypothetical protein